MLRYFTAIFFLVLLCQCGAPQPPPCHSVPRASRVPAATLMAEARRNWNILANPARSSEWSTASTGYNSAVAKLFDQLRCGKDGWDARAAALGTRIAPQGLNETDPRVLDAVFPASLADVSVVHSRKTTWGIGVSAVGWKQTAPVGGKRAKYLLPNGLPYNITLVLSFEQPGAPVWRFTKRWKLEDIRIGGTTHTLAADWTAANAFYWHMCDLDDLKIQNVILPERYMEETGIYFITPYDPEKIPIVFVHGLVSSPDAFKNMINELVPEPWFRQHYQIWVYNYPTGNPWLFSSMKFREVMHDACSFARSKGHDRNLNRMVIVAHSMGGLLTRSSVVDPGKTLYAANYLVPPDQLKTTPANREFIKKSLLYKPLKEPRRVVFLAVPHRGSPAANMRISTWISRLIRLPKTITVDLLDSTLQAVGDIAQGKDASPHLPTSIDSLSPNYKNNKALDTIPLPGRITFHSIIGDRGKGNTPASSDGVVPYWSSHITPVASELIVPSHHSVQDNPMAATELKRILKLHLNSKN